MNGIELQQFREEIVGCSLSADLNAIIGNDITAGRDHGRFALIEKELSVTTTNIFPDAPASSPEIYSFVQGDFNIDVLSDGHITVPIDIVLPDGTPAERAEVLRKTGDLKDGLVRSKANIPLLRKGNEQIIVDIGSGDKYQPSDGRLPANLLAAGIDPSAITKVVLTHGHPDHMWAMLDADGKLRFPNATYFVGASEWDFWMDPDYRTNMPAEIHEFAEGAQRDFSAIRERVVMLQPGDDIVSGLRVLDTAGHTLERLAFM